MGINVNDLAGELQPVGASLLSGNENVLDNLRELTAEELRICGGGKGKGGFGFGKGKGKGKGFALASQQPFIQSGGNPQAIQPGAISVGGVPVTGIPIGGFPQGSNINITINVISESSSTSTPGSIVDTRTASL